MSRYRQQADRLQDTAASLRRLALREDHATERAHAEVLRLADVAEKAAADLAAVADLVDVDVAIAATPLVAKWRRR